MDSSFLTVMEVGLGLYSLIAFLKLVIQFGLPNHPLRFTAYLVSLCAVISFGAQAGVDLGLIAPWFWMKWRPLPIVAGSLALLIQVVTMVGNFSLIQQKVISRLPLIAALLCFAFFPTKAEIFLALTLIAGTLFLTVSVKKVRYQKRQYLKMVFFLALFQAVNVFHLHWIWVLSQIFLFFALFYFFVFEQTFGVSALIAEHRDVEAGVVK